MATNFPTSKQTFTDPTGANTLDSPDHAGLHTDMNDTVEAVQDKIGTGASTPTSGKILTGTGVGTSEWADPAATLSKASKAEAAAGTDDTKYLTALTTAELFKMPEGYMYNGKIVPSVTSDNLTVALKGKDGNDPSATNPVYVMIGGTLRSITAALSVTKNAGTNWCNAGSSELATKEIDYFVYLGYNATDGVVVGFSRIPSANSYDDFSATTTNEKYCAISTITNAAATDYYNVVGRFAATLSAGAGYTWTVPTFTAKNLIQRPIYETRSLSWTPTWGGYSASPGGSYLYRLVGSRCFIDTAATTGTSNANTNTMTCPFKFLVSYDTIGIAGAGIDNGSAVTNIIRMDTSAGGATATFYKAMNGTVWTTSGTKSVKLIFNYEI